MTTKVSYYEILNLDVSCSHTDVKKNYRNLAKIYHPDNSKTGDRELFELISKAYECLNDPNKRIEYDELLNKKEEDNKHGHDALMASYKEFLKTQSLGTKPNNDKILLPKQDKDIALTKEELKILMRDRDQTREQEEIELSQKNVFKDKAFDLDKFNALFDKYSQEHADSLVQHTGQPEPLGGVYDIYSLNDSNDVNNFVNEMYVDITDEDINNIDNMHRKMHTSGKSISELLKERELDDEYINNMSFKDYDTKIAYSSGAYYNDLEDANKNSNYITNDEHTIDIDNNLYNKLFNTIDHKKQK